MISRIRYRLLAIAAFVLPMASTSAETLTNESYRLELREDGTIQVTTAQEQPVRLTPSFTVLYSAQEPGYHRNNSNYPLAPRTSLRWAKYQQPVDDLNRWLKEEMGLATRVTEDAKGDRTWDYGPGRLKVAGQYAQGTTNPFLAGERFDLLPQNTLLDGRTMRWEFAPNPNFTLVAGLTLPAGEGDPQISYTMTAAKPGYFAVAFTGAPAVDEKAAPSVPQLAAGRGGKQFHHVVAEVTEKLPRAHVSDGRQSFVVVAHPDSVPFTEKLLDFKTSRFGTMIRKEHGRLTPVMFAPVMGADSSRMEAGEHRGFKLLFVARPGDWQAAYRYVAESIYGVRDQRDNSGPGSLNATIARVRDYLADRNGKNYALWHAEQKYYDYWSDKSGIFKPFSPLYGLSAAVVLDDEAFYRTRALPAVEFSLSRMSNVFSPYDVKDTGQVRTQDRRLGKPYLPLPQLVSAWEFHQRRTHAFRQYAEQATPASGIMDLLADWKLTGNAAQLDAALAAGERGLKGGGGAYMDFLELYEATGDTRFMEAARARIYAQISTGVNLFPKVPDRDMIYDRGGKVPVHAHSFGRHAAWGFPPPEGLPTREQQAPAWRGSEIGLESFSHHRAELWPNQPPQLLRTAAYSGDSFLRTVARWGLVGRYANYAGDNRTERSLVTELPDAPEHPIWKLTYSSINPGHAWEFIGAMLDFLVTDCFDRSSRQIAFPGSTLSGSPFRVQVYGALPGRFYDEEGVRLWCPSDLLVIDNPQIDWLAAWGNGKLYLAFWNQSFRDEQVTVQLNKSRVAVAAGAGMRQWENNRAGSVRAHPGDKLEFNVAAKGIQAFAIGPAETRTTLQAKIFDPAAPHLGTGSIQTLETPFGKVHGMLLSLGRGLTNAFVYTDALPENVITARCRWRQGGGEWKSRQDDVFPFEFSVWLDDDAGDFEAVLEVETTRLEKAESGPLVLEFAAKGKGMGILPKINMIMQNITLLAWLPESRHDTLLFTEGRIRFRGAEASRCATAYEPTIRDETCGNSWRRCSC
jgi:hypothetical protein